MLDKTQVVASRATHREGCSKKRTVRLSCGHFLESLAIWGPPLQKNAAKGFPVGRKKVLSSRIPSIATGAYLKLVFLTNALVMLGVMTAVSQIQVTLGMSGVLNMPASGLR